MVQAVEAVEDVLFEIGAGNAVILALNKAPGPGKRLSTTRTRFVTRKARRRRPGGIC